MTDRERLDAYKALLRAPADPMSHHAHRITAPVSTSHQTRIRRYLRHALIYLMHRDLARDGDLD